MRYNSFIIFIIFSIILLTQLRSEEIDDSPKLGLALSGGGAKGLAHIGVLKVLEEEGIHFDYITGTSMGSIVGGLYAIGYRSDDLDKLVTTVDWNDLLLDRISRRNLSMEEKQDENRYAGAFPIENWKISLPQGLVSGQQIQALLADLTLSVHDIEDFRQLPIPFLCIATDIEKGQAVILDQGNLSDAIRASMSIPSAFTPIELEGQLLVDGGLVRNFPVSDVKELGADLVIGIDVAAPLQLKSDLKSLTSIMNQSISLMGAASTANQRKMVDLLIEPDVDDFSILDFNDVKAIIAKGEEAARKILPQIREFKKQLKYREIIEPNLLKIDSIFVDKIYIQGLRDVSKNLVIGKLGLDKDKWLTIDEINRAVERVYGSGYFQRVTFKLDSNDDGVNLFIRCTEKTSNFLKFGIHYDSDMKSAVLLNSTFRNFLVQGSKLSLDLRLSENEGGRFKYFIHTGWKPGFGFALTIENDNFKVNVRNKSDILEASYDYKTNFVNLEMQTIFSNSFTIGGYLKSAVNKLQPIIIPDYYPNETTEYYFFTTGGYLLVDTMNKANYATKGQYLKISYENVYQLDEEKESLNEPFSNLYCEYKSRFALIKNLSLLVGGRFGKIFGSNIPLDSEYYIGGFSRTKYTFLPFIGHEFMSIHGESVAIYDGSLQWELWEGIYLTYRYNGARAGKYFDESQDYYGTGLSLGLFTPTGPFEVTIMKGDTKSDIQTYLKIGYDF